MSNKQHTDISLKALYEIVPETREIERLFQSQIGRDVMDPDVRAKVLTITRGTEFKAKLREYYEERRNGFPSFRDSQ